MTSLVDVIGKPNGVQNQCFGHIGQPNCCCPYCQKIRETLRPTAQQTKGEE